MKCFCQMLFFFYAWHILCGRMDGWADWWVGGKPGRTHFTGDAFFAILLSDMVRNRTASPIPSEVICLYIYVLQVQSKKNVTAWKDQSSLHIPMYVFLSDEWKQSTVLLSAKKWSRILDSETMHLTVQKHTNTFALWFKLYTITCDTNFGSSVNTMTSFLRRNMELYCTGWVIWGLGGMMKGWEEVLSEDVKDHCPLTTAFSLIRQHKRHKNGLQIISQVINYWCLSGLDV